MNEDEFDEEEDDCYDYDTSSDDDSYENIEYVKASPLNLEIVSLEEVNEDQEEKEFDLEDFLQIQDVILHEKLLNIYRLIANIESLNDNPTPDHVLKSPSLVPISITDSDSSFEKSDTSFSHLGYFLPNSTTCSGSYGRVEPDQGRLISIVISDNSNNPVLELPEFESFQFDLYDDPSFPCPSPEPLDVERVLIPRSPPRNRYIAAKTDISLKGGRPPRYRRAIFTTLVESSLIIETNAPVINNFDKLNKDKYFDPGGDEINVEVDNSFTFVTWIFLPYLTYPEDANTSCGLIKVYYLLPTDQDDSQIPALEDIYDNLSDGIFTNASYSDEGVEADFTNLETTVNEELLQFKIQKVWILVDLPFGKKEIGKNGQEEGIDYDEVFAPVARTKAIRIFLDFASYIGFIVYQMDVKSAFLYGTTDEEVYVSQPLVFVDPKFPKKVYKVVKDLYGLHQAPKAWYATLSTFLLKSGYRRGTIDKTLFIKKDKNHIMLVQVYVDDIIFGSTKRSWCDEFETLIKSRFQMSSIGELTFFLGLQVKQKEDGIFISQDKYVAEIMKKFDFASVKTANTPIENQKSLTKDEEAIDVDVHLYRSMIDSLMYLTASRPDIMFELCACSRFQVTPKTSHLYAVKRILRYLKGKPKLGLWYPRVSSFDLEAYSDNDYAGANLDRKSTIKEYVAAANCCGQVLWIQNQMLDYGFNFMNTKIYIDNESIICIVKNPAFHSKTKRIEIRHHFIMDAYEKKLIQVLKIHTNDNVADLLTKAFAVSSSQTVNDEKQIHATVDSKAVVVTEASIRSSLLLNDVAGTACLTNEAIFQNLALMGYEGELNKLTFQKSLFSPQWKYLIHTILHCLSSKSTSWNEFSTNIASAVICLATNQKFNFSKLIFDGMLRNLDNPKKKFLMYPRFLMVFLNNQIELGEPFNDVYLTPAHTLKVFSNMSRKGLKFSGRITPLFSTMLASAEVEEGEGSEQPTESQPPPSPTQPSVGDQPHVTESSSGPDNTHSPSMNLEGTGGNEGDQVQLSNDSPHSGGNTSERAEGGLNLKELLSLCTNLSNRVLALETAKDAQAAKILKLKTRIKKLEKKCKPSISHHRAWLKSVKRLSMKKRLGQKEPVSKQGRKNVKPGPTLDAFDDLDADLAHGMDYMDTEEAVTEGRQSKETEEQNVTHDTEVLEKGGSNEEPVNAAGNIGVSTAVNISTASRPEVSTATPMTPPTTTNVFEDEDIFLADALVMLSDKAKLKGVEIEEMKDAERPARSVLTLKPLPKFDPKDKGTGVLEEEPEPVKVKPKDQGEAQIKRDAEIALKVQAKLNEEARLERQEQASLNYIANLYDEVQARIDADHELAIRWTQEKQEKYTVDERAKLLAEYFENRKK
ncbi:putative ribonuclease H-like domain-containing protein [Tanacetum coccineum]